MIDKSILKQVLIDQHLFDLEDHYIERDTDDLLSKYYSTPEVIILLGIRRCGKSTLLQMIRKKSKQQDYYLNFDDERLVQFQVDDFQYLHELFIELYGVQNTFFFDEIQNIPDWERFIRRLHDAGNKIYITGSNATLFSQELGTRLTGRYIEISIYPFSYREIIRYKEPQLLTKTQLTTIEKSQLKNLCQYYVDYGGFPIYLKFQMKEYLQTLYESILYRDIISRYQIQAIQSFKELAFYLASNIAKDVSYNALKKVIGVKNASTVSDFCHYFSMSFLCFFVQRYDVSLKKQIYYPKKIYWIDTALSKIIGFRQSDDHGRMIENGVFLELRRRGFEIYFHKQKKECDFVLRSQGKIIEAIQVCYHLQDEKTKKRELDGLIEAMQAYHLHSGTIITWDEEDELTIDADGFSYAVSVIPFYKWLLATVAVRH